jgi:ribosomal protein S3AE
VASNDEVKEIIKKQFSDAEGKFDFKFYEGYLRNQMGKTPGQYEEMQRENIRANMFEQLILETGLASNLQLKDSYKNTNEKVALSLCESE